MTSSDWWSLIERARGMDLPVNAPFTIDDFSERTRRWKRVLESASLEACIEAESGLWRTVNELWTQGTWAVMYLVEDSMTDQHLSDTLVFLVSWGKEAVDAVRKDPAQLERYLNPSGDPANRQRVGVVGLAPLWSGALADAIESKSGRPYQSSVGPAKAVIKEDPEAAIKRFPALARKYGKR